MPREIPDFLVRPSEYQENFTIPNKWLENNKGYRVKLQVKDENNQVLDSKIMALAIEDDWKKFPRYGTVAGSQDINNSILDNDKILEKYEKDMQEMKNMHINAHFYYDVYKNLTDPLPKAEKIMPQKWNWWTHSVIDNDIYYFREDGSQVKEQWVEVDDRREYYDEHTGSLRAN